MEIRDSKINGNQFEAIFDYEANVGNASNTTLYSRKYLLCNAVEFQLRATSCFSDQKYHVIFIFVRFNILRDDGLEYCLHFSSDTLLVPEIVLYCNNGIWQLISEQKNDNCEFDVTASVNIVSGGSSWAALYEDMDFADFRLRGEDGTVFAHRAALAAASPVLLRMLAGEWKEAAEGAVDVPGTSKATLQNLKRYIYLQELPDTGLEQLLLLAAYYIMPALEKQCTHKLICHLTSDNAFELLEFAVTHKQTNLSMDILEIIQRDKLNISDIRKNVTREKAKRDS